VLVIVLVIKDIENRTMCQHKKSIDKRGRLFEPTCVMFLVDYDYEHEHDEGNVSRGNGTVYDADGMM